MWSVKIRKEIIFFLLVFVVFNTNAQKIVTLASDTISYIQNTYPNPYNKWSFGARHQFLIYGSELAFGIDSMQPGNITAISFYVDTFPPPGEEGYVMKNFSIKMKNTTLFDLITIFENTGLTTVLQQDSFMIDKSGWNRHTLDIPFYWDGFSNLLIETCFDDDTAFFFNPILNFMSTPFISTTVNSTHSTNVCSAITIDTFEYARPHIQLTYLPTNCVGPCVWPGDANNDLIANNFDLLNLGVAFNFMGPNRANPTLQWIGQSAFPWPYQFASFTDYKHADCNGDGKISQDDVISILLNYNKVHNKASIANSAICPGDPPLYFNFLQDTVNAGDTLDVQILFGVDSILANNIYGVAFTINYDPLLVKSVASATFDSSWIDPTNLNNVYLVYPFNSNGEIDVAYSRIDQTNQSGFGGIAMASFVMEEDLAGKLPISKIFTFSFSDVKVIDANENNIPVCFQYDSVVVFQSVEHMGSFTDRIKVYPNPVDAMLNINLNGVETDAITIRNIMGQTIYRTDLKYEDLLKVNMDNYPTGLYYIIFETKHGLLIKDIALINQKSIK